eukprot:14946418-Ditylum_brightwellii.AAC.1
MADGYPSNKETRFLVWQWTHQFLLDKGLIPYNPAFQELTDYGILQVKERVKAFGVFLADIATDFTENP